MPQPQPSELVVLVQVSAHVSDDATIQQAAMPTESNFASPRVVALLVRSIKRTSSVVGMCTYGENSSARTGGEHARVMPV